MKTAIKLTTGTLAIALTMTMGAAFCAQAEAQNPDAIDNARSVAKSLQQKQANDTDAALNAAGVPATTSKPAPGAPAPAVKPAVIPGEQKPIVLAPPKPVPAAAAPADKPAAKAAAPKAEPASGANNQLTHVNVVPGSDDIQIEISSSRAMTPRVTKLSSPARLLVELPETVVASAQNKIPVGSGGVKGVRIGMDGKNPPTTSVVVDLEKALAYDVAPGPAGKVTLILHTQGDAPAVAKSAPAPTPAKASSAKPLSQKLLQSPRLRRRKLQKRKSRLRKLPLRSRKPSRMRKQPPRPRPRVWQRQLRLRPQPSLSQPSPRPKRRNGRWMASAIRSSVPSCIKRDRVVRQAKSAWRSTPSTCAES